MEQRNQTTGTGRPHNQSEGTTGSAVTATALTLFLLFFLLLFHLLQHLPCLLQLLLCVRRVEPLPEMPKAPIILWGRIVRVRALGALVT